VSRRCAPNFGGLSRYGGQTLQLKFDAQYQQQVPAEFKIDDVSVRVPKTFGIPPRNC
jgi:hypothetical protein